MSEVLEATERMLLGALILDPRWLGFCAEKLQPHDFGSWRWGEVYRLLLDLESRGEKIDATTVPIHAARILRDRVTISDVTELVDGVPSSAAVRTYLAEVAESAKRRRARQALQDALAALDGRGVATVDEIADGAAAALQQAVATQEASSGWVTIGDAAAEVCTRVRAVTRGEITSGGLKLGVGPLDGILGGLHPGDLCLLGARPGMGKTALAMQVAEHVAQVGGTVGVMSLEMPRAQLAMRRLAARSKIPVKRLRDGHLTAEELVRLDAAQKEIARMPVVIDDSAGITGEQARARMRKLWAHRSDLKLLVLDYIQLLRGEDDRVSREQQLAAISRGLKTDAKEMGLPILALAQLSRGLEQRKDRRPMISDLRESGALEQDADQIVFLYREEVYERDNPDIRGVAEAIVAKNRHGAPGTAMLKWVGWLTRFEDPDSHATVEGPREDPAIAADDGSIPF